MGSLFAAVIALSYVTSLVSGHIAVARDAVNAMAVSWTSEQLGDPEPFEEPLLEDVSDASIYEDDVLASQMYILKRGVATPESSGTGEAGHAGSGMIEARGAVPAETDSPYMDTHILHASEAMKVVPYSGRHLETSGMMLAVLMVMAAAGFVFAAILLCKAFGSPLSANGPSEPAGDDTDPRSEGKLRDVGSAYKVTSCACEDGSGDVRFPPLLKRTQSTSTSVDQ